MLLTVMPGPDIIYVLVQSVTNGKNMVLQLRWGWYQELLFILL